MVARAEETAAELYKRATAQYNLGKFLDAAKGYERVFEIHPDPVILYNIAQAYRLAGGNEEKALFFYKSYRAQVPKAQNRAEVEERIATLERIVTEQKTARERPPNEPTPRPTPTTSPTPTTQTTTTTTTTTATAASTAAATARPTPQPLYKKWWLWTIVGVGAAGIALGVGLGIGLSDTPRFDPNLPDGGPMGATLRF
jgi:tetratricopeptide (TPR) repeat protein